MYGYRCLFRVHTILGTRPICQANFSFVLKINKKISARYEIDQSITTGRTNKMTVQRSAIDTVYGGVRTGILVLAAGVLLDSAALA